MILNAPQVEAYAAFDAIAQRADAILADTTVSDGRHLVIADRRRRHRIWIRPQADHADATYSARVDDQSGIRLAAAMQFNRWLQGSGPELSRPLLIPTPYQRQRLVQILRIADAGADGAALRETAYTVLFPNHPLPTAAEWKGSSERRACHRLAAAANRLIMGDYRKLLTA